ncbi:MAG TPA: hypothetical protein VJ953_18585 [Saprospiraceae bacterium]|nr:hypothetical protein [Saprospiraceae bacterium]
MMSLDKAYPPQGNVLFSMVQVFNTNTTTNLNSTSNYNQDIPITGQTAYFGTAVNDFLVVGDGIRILTTGIYQISVNVHLNSSISRSNVVIRAKTNNTPIGPVGASAYIRGITGHNESSAHLQFMTSLAAQDIITIGARREARNGAVTMAEPGTSNLIIKKLA